MSDGFKQCSRCGGFVPYNGTVDLGPHPCAHGTLCFAGKRCRCMPLPMTPRLRALLLAYHAGTDRDELKAYLEATWGPALGGPK